MPDQTIEQSVADAMKQIKQIDDQIILEVAGVAQALDQLRKALDKVDVCLGARNYEKISSLGYSDVSSEFIFLQRTLGGLQTAHGEKEMLISELVVKSGATSFEEVEPFVNKRMISAQPREM